MALLPRAKTTCAALSVVAAFGAPPAWSACSSPQGGGAIPDVAGPIAVVGVLTEFASLCVNGLEIHYDNATPVTVNGRRATARDLAPGQVLAVEVRSAGGQLAAQSIAIVRVLEGPVTRVDSAAATLYVMDQPVRVTEETVGLPRERLLELRPGATIEVSGYRNARGEVVASRVDLAPPRSGHSAVGLMRQNGARDAQMGSLQIALPGPRPSGMASESDVLVRGLWDGGALRAGSVTEDPSMQLLGRAERAVVESLVQEPRRGDRLRVGGLQVRVGRATRIDGTPAALQVGQSVRVTGVPGRGHAMAAERIAITPAGQVRAASLAESDAASQARAAAAEEAARAERMRRDNPAIFRAERLERPDRDAAAPERAERTESARLDRPEPVRVERPEKAEKPEKPEKVEPIRIEIPRLERPERSERSGSNSGRN